jgi:hypothetical protein
MNLGWPADGLFDLDEKATTRRKPLFKGRVCGWYRNSDGRLGYTIEADAIPGLIHIYPQEALDRMEN